MKTLVQQIKKLFPMREKSFSMVTGSNLRNVKGFIIPKSWHQNSLQNHTFDK